MNPPPTLSYESSINAPPTNINGLLNTARRCAWVGLIVPVIGPIGILWALLALIQRRVGKADRDRAFRTITLCLVLSTVNLVTLAFLLASDNGQHHPRLFCSSNLRQIGLAILMYANENNDQFPPDFATLIRTQDIEARCFVCPSSETDDRATFTGTPTTQQVADSVIEGSTTCSYYLCKFPGQRLSQLAPSTPIAFEKLEDHDGDGINVLYADGHVDWIPAPAAKALVSGIIASPNAPTTLPTIPAK